MIFGGFCLRNVNFGGKSEFFWVSEMMMLLN